MSDRLTPNQLQKLVAEVERLQNRQQEELDTVQMREILQELNLSPDLLPDAMVQLHRREALAVQQRRRRWMIAGVLALGVMIASGAIAFLQYQQQVFERVGAQADHLVTQPDSGRPVSRITRPANLTYEITLNQAPVGQTLSLRCDWLNPAGQVVKQNRYTTRIITTDIWQTQCRYDLDSVAAPGTWTVKLFLGDRQLSDATFEVR